MKDKGTYSYDGDIQELFLKASDRLNSAVEHTIGPNGSNSAVPVQNDFLSIINDGKSIIERISSDEPALKLAINTLKESSFATNKNASDGTTSSIVLQNKLLHNVLDYNKFNKELIDSKYLISIRDLLLDKLQSFKLEIKNEKDLKNIITVSLGGDTYTDLVYKAFENLNNQQKPALVKSDSTQDVSVDFIDGVNLSSVEINPVALRYMPLSVNEPINVIIIKQQVSRIDNAFAALLNKISKSNKKTVLIYTEIMPSVMDQILFNIQEGSLSIVPVLLRLHPDQFDDIISELGKYFNCNVIDDLNPYQTCYNSDEIFGTGTGYILNKGSIVIKNNNEDYSSEILPAKSSVINVGFTTFSQQDELYKRFEDAIGSTYNARNSGYVLGAGYTYFCLSSILKDLNDKRTEPIQQALIYIFDYLFESTGKENITPEILEFINYIEENIFDSYKVAEQVILNSFTVVSQVLSTKCVLVNY